MIIRKRKGVLSVNRRSFAVAGLAAVATPATIRAQSDSDDELDARRTTITRWVEEVVNAGDFGVVPDLVSDDYTSPEPTDAPGVDALVARLEGVRQRNEAQFQSVPTFTVEDMLVSMDSGGARLTMTFEYRGRQAVVEALMWYAFDGAGRIASIWNLYDTEELSHELYG
jgi:hypothetical protein